MEYAAVYPLLLDGRGHPFRFLRSHAIMKFALAGRACQKPAHVLRGQ